MHTHRYEQHIPIRSRKLHLQGAVFGGRKWSRTARIQLNDHNSNVDVTIWSLLNYHSIMPLCLPIAPESPQLMALPAEV